MKKSLCALTWLLVCLSLAALPACGNYIWNLNATDPINGPYVSSTTLGTLPTPVTAARSWVVSTSAYTAEVKHTGPLGPGFVTTVLLRTDLTPVDPITWYVAAWCGADYVADMFSVRIWASIDQAPPPSDLYLLYNPITDTWGRTKLNTDPIASTSSGSQSDPWFRYDLPACKTADPTAYGTTYIFELTPIPEPSSILALFCVTAGFGGMVWRRVW